MNDFPLRPIVVSFGAMLLLLFASGNVMAAVTIGIIANPSKAAPGERVRYEVTLSNDESTTQSVSLAARVPTGTTVARNELAHAAMCNGGSFSTCTAGQTLQFAAFNLPAETSVTVVYPALISTSPPPANGTALRSTANATIGAIVLQAKASATVNAAAASLVQLTASTSPVAPGSLLTYTLAYGNPGASAVRANLTFPLPALTTFVSASDGGTLGAGVVTWTLGMLTPGSAARRTVVVRLADEGNSQLTAAAALRNPATQAVLMNASVTIPLVNNALNAHAVATPDPAAPGQRVRYAVTVSNTAGTSQAVNLTATVPANTTVARNELSLTAVCDGGSFTTCTAGQTLQFAPFNIAAGASVTVVYPALISTSSPPPDGTLLNSDIWLQDATNGNESEQNITALASSAANSGVHLTASSLPALPLAGGTVTYTLTYGNPGSAAVRADLTFPLPPLTTFVSASDGGTLSAGVVTWTLGVLAPGSAARRTVVLQVSNSVWGLQLAVDAALRNPTTQAVLTHAALTTPVGGSTFTVAAVATPDPAAPGQRVNYAVTVTNLGTGPATLTATVPPNTTVARNELSLPANCDGATFTTCAAGQTLQFTLFNVAGGASVTVVYPALISTSAPPPDGTLLNSDIWMQSASNSDVSQLSVAAIASSTAVNGVHLTVGTLPTQVFYSYPFNYTLTYGNAGSTAVKANLTFPVPAGTTFLSTPDGGTLSAGVVTWALGTLAPGTAGRRTVWLQVSPFVPGGQLSVDAALRNPTTQAVLTHAGLTTPISNTTVCALNARAVATPDPAGPGQRVSYAVTVSNAATTTHAVNLTATVPANTTVARNELSLPADCDGGTFTTCTAGQTLQFSAFNVAAGASVIVVYPALISTSTPPSNGTLLNSDVWLQDATNGNEFQLSTAAIASNTAISGIHLTASALPSQPLHVENMSYTLTYGNAGSAAVNANLSFLLPSGTLFMSASDGGTLSASTVTWTLGTLAPGSAGRRTLAIVSGNVAGSQLAVDAQLLDPTAPAVLTHAALTTPMGSQTEAVLNAQAVATPDPAAPGQRVSYAVTVSNTDVTAHAVNLTATVPANTTVARSELSLAADCDGGTFTTCTAGQTLQFSQFTVAAGGSVTVTYPALISTSRPPSDGTLLNSNVWMQDATNGNEYWSNVAAIASSTALSAAYLTASPLPTLTLAGRAMAIVNQAATPRWQAHNSGIASSDAGHFGAAIQPQTSSRPVRATANAASPSTRVIVVLDQSSIDGGKAVTNTDERWQNYLTERLRSATDVSAHIVLVAPQADGMESLAATNLSRALAQLARGVSIHGAAKYEIILDGNGESALLQSQTEQVTAEQIIAMHRHIVDQARALGLKIFGATITPFEGTTYPNHTPLDERNRVAVNAWIRTRGVYDAVIDFDAVTRDPQHLARLLSAYDSGDHLHPNDNGYQAMADAIDTSLFE